MEHGSIPLSSGTSAVTRAWRRHSLVSCTDYGDPACAAEIKYTAVTMHRRSCLALKSRSAEDRRSENKAERKWKKELNFLCMMWTLSPRVFAELCLLITSAPTGGFHPPVAAVKTSLCPEDFQQNKEHINTEDLPGQEVTVAAGTNTPPHLPTSHTVLLHPTLTLTSPPSTSQHGHRYKTTCVTFVSPISQINALLEVRRWVEETEDDKMLKQQQCLNIKSWQGEKNKQNIPTHKVRYVD